ncbi:uncharacterized protein LOC126835755 [Adelges cooleyi]|uniref:uncharacterized protein LOC126835755 n=1 Tax=Adelges cooleyi TaxID=133065 RepID=UPI00217F4C7E|nr:uncharacterized protein LOC126835755 [Adelges cooleyi]
MIIKMIFYIYLISYAFVNVLSDTIDMSEYINEFHITNELMENASNTIGNLGNLNGLAYTLKRVISQDAYTMEELNFMFTIPDQADVLDLNKYIGYQRKMQIEIFLALHIDRHSVDRTVHDWSKLGEKRRELTRKAILQLFLFEIYSYYSNYSLKQKCQLIGLGLNINNPLNYAESAEEDEFSVCLINHVNGIRGLAYTIKRTITGDAYTMEELNFMFAIPDQADVLDLDKYIGYQRKMQNEIIMTLHIDRPSVNSALLDWSKLGNKRRDITRRAIIQLFNKDFYREKYSSYSFKQICQLIGLALSTIDPLQHTKSVEVSNYNICVIKNVNDILSWYKEFEQNYFYEVYFEPYARRGQRLMDRLANGLSWNTMG